jgi:hypothetical protein
MRRSRTRSGMSPREMFGEALAGVLQRPGRSVLTMVGAVLGVATVVVLGLTASEAGQVSKQFTILSSTEVDVEEAPAATDSAAGTELPRAEHELLPERVGRAAGRLPRLQALPPGREPGVADQCTDLGCGILDWLRAAPAT